LVQDMYNGVKAMIAAEKELALGWIFKQCPLDFWGDESKCRTTLGWGDYGWRLTETAASNLTYKI